MPQKFGICMEGNEAALERALKLAHDVDTADDLQVFEIGTASGQSTRGMAEYLHGLMEDNMYERYFRIVTCDIPGGWSLNEAAAYAVTEEFPSVEVAVCENGGRGYLATLDPLPHVPIHFALVDGCHGAACVEADFLAIEKKSVVGTVVVFHDANKRCQGLHMQPHCGTPIDVRRGLKNVGLLRGNRPGWTMVEETDAPHGIIVYQRIA